MSKKMVKRSLVLGALMTFVITGSALAAGTTSNKSETVNGSLTDGYANVKEIVNVVDINCESNILTIANGSSLAEGSSIYNVYVKAKGMIETIGNKTIVDTDSDENIKGEIFNVYDYGINSEGDTSIKANNNTLEVGGNSKVGSVGSVKLDMYAKTAGNIEAKNNIVKILGNAIVETTEGVYGIYVGDGDVNLGNITAVVENNQVIIADNANVKADKGIYGAYVQTFSKTGGVIQANNNSVTISGNAIIDENTKVYGGYAESLENKDGFDYVTNADGTVTESIKDLYGGTATNLSATAIGNIVNITGNAVVKGEVYGGYASAFEGSTGQERTTNASNNIINVSDDADISGAVLVGSKTELVDEKTVSNTYENSDAFDEGGEPTSKVESGGSDLDTSAQNTSNNTLNISKNWTGGDGGKKVDTLGNFDEIVIEEMKYGEAALDVENMNYKEADVQGNGGTKLTVNKMTMSGDQELSGELEIIKTTNSNLKNENNQNKGAISEESSVTIYKGTSEIIDVGFGGEDGMKLKEENIKKTTRNDQVLVIGESRAAATAFVNQGSELVETGLDALARDNAKAGDTKAFAAVYGNASEYATGSHVKVNGWSGIVGVGKTNANGLTVGAFFENGTGNYRTYNTVNNDFMRGDGEATYNGGGLLVRKDNANGVYTEASLRAGNLQNELRKAVRGSEGLTGYDVDTFYYGAHVGVGKIIPRGNEGDSIDVYGKFIYTHHDSENFKIDGSDFHFDSVDSERLRLGFRINEVQSNKLSMYYGAAWEYEFGGDADNTTVGYDLSTPSLGGSTMIGEIGMHYLASEKWSLDLNLRGYSGQRDGFTGSVQANYNF